MGSAAWVKNLLWFAAGCIVATAILAPQMKNVRQSGQHAFELENQVRSIQAGLHLISQQRDACNAKFEHATMLYDPGLPQTRAWFIPADVEPIAMGQKRGTYTHYDPKTQTETVHFQPKAQ